MSLVVAVGMEIDFAETRRCKLPEVRTSEEKNAEVRWLYKLAIGRQ